MEHDVDIIIEDLIKFITRLGISIQMRIFLESQVLRWWCSVIISENQECFASMHISIPVLLMKSPQWRI